jgi:hypothetical protein
LGGPATPAQAKNGEGSGGQSAVDPRDTGSLEADCRLRGDRQDPIDSVIDNEEISWHRKVNLSPIDLCDLSA